MARRVHPALVAAAPGARVLLPLFVAAAIALPPARASVELTASRRGDPAVEIGVLSVLDTDDTGRRWQALAEALSTALPRRRFIVRALDASALETAVRDGALTFVVTNPGHYVLLEDRYGASRIATQAADPAFDPGHSVGAAVVARPGGDAPSSLEALRGRRVAAVDPQAFGGYRVIAAEWARRGIDAERGDVTLAFTGFPMTRVIDAVLDGRADAGIVRTCLLEQLVADGRLAEHALVVVAPRTGEGVACRTSSPLYPGWAFATLPGTPPPLAREVLIALLSHPPGGGETRWSAPAGYERVHDVLRTLEVEPYAFLRQTRLDALARRYWFVIGGVLSLIALGGFYTLRVEALVQRRTAELRRSLDERDRLATQLAHDREAMDHLSRLSILGELSATLGHELNQPLATIENYASGLQRRIERGALSDAALRQALGDIAGEAERAARILEAVRALARKRVAVRRHVDAAALAAEAVGLFRGLDPSARIRVARDDEHDALWITADPLQVQQVLLNLLKNGLDAHRAAGTPDATIDLELGRSGDHVRLGVRDRGAPLRDDQRAKLFEPFHTTKPDGLGLGLTICRTIVEAHGGAMRADPADARGGMRFDVLLPAAASPRDEPRRATT